ncbi:MAG: peptidoglycan DD-metalloendopeptidase family protein [Egibacteraceae bacterium]
MSGHGRALAARAGRVLAARHPAVLAIAALLGLATGLIGLLVLVATLGVAPARGDHGLAVEGIPAVVLDAYLNAETLSPHLGEGCAVRWQILAGIGKVESGHASHGGATVLADGTVDPPIIGIALDGTRGTARIPDTDGGRWDGDPVWDRAVGPMQFIPSSWERFGQDGNGDGTRDPNNIYDAALAAAAHLCWTRPGDYTDRQQLSQALLAYNRSSAYVRSVISWIDQYDHLDLASTGAPLAIGSYALPVHRDLLTLPLLRRPHHTYPAWDLGLAEGTPVYAVHGGVVVSVPARNSRCGLGAVVDGDDGYRYIYCHASGVAVAQGDRVAAGDLLLWSGNTGNSTGPHLHLGIRDAAGRNRCPQDLLVAWYEGIPLSPDAAPARGCTH